MECKGVDGRRVVAMATTLFILALVWRLAFNLVPERFHNDEIAYGIPGITQIAAGHALIYCGNSSQMAPICEYLSASTVKLWGVNRWTVRWPVALVTSVAVMGLFVLSLRLLSFWPAVGFGVLLACPSSAVLGYSLLLIPEYGMGLLLVTLLLCATLAVDRHRSWMSWAGFGLLSGVSIYAFPPSQPAIAACGLWLFGRSDYGRELWLNRLGWKRVGPWLVAAVLVLGPLVYHYFTRPLSYHPGRVEAVAWAIGMALLLVTVGMWWRVFPVRKEWLLSAIGCGVLILAVPMIPHLYFERVVRPTLAGQELRDSPPFQLKHVHEWKENVAIYGEYVFHQLIFGQYTAYMAQREGVTFGRRSILTAVTCMLVASGMALAWRRHREDVEWRANLMLLMLPLVVTFILVSPSWLLFGDASLRYFYPYWWAFWLAAWVGLFGTDRWGPSKRFFMPLRELFGVG